MDEFVLVSEAEIAAAMRRYHAAHEDIVEGAAGVAIAAMLARRGAIRGMNVVVIICGGNISEQALEKISNASG